MATPRGAPGTQTGGRSTLSSEAIIFAALFAFRLINAHYVQTFFQPDEYFQALEPAWDLAFGPDSGAWITWEWREGLRTSVHPFLFAGVYRLVDWACLLLEISAPSRANVLIVAPRVLQALFAASLDLMTIKLASRIYGRQPASFATAFLTVFSPWQWYCSTRTFSNSLEATLTAAALCFFPWNWFLRPDKDDNALFLTSNFNWANPYRTFKITPPEMYLALVCAATAFYFRPTNLVIWAAISLAVIACNRNLRKAWALLHGAVLVGFAVVAAFALVDRMYYYEWTFPPLRFVYFNLVQSLAIFYGSNRIDYYFTEGLPLLLITALPFAGYGIWESLQHGKVQSTAERIERNIRFVLAFAVIGTVLVLSTIAHKEMRFIYPLLPMLHILAAKPFAHLFDPYPRPRSRSRQLILAGIVAINIYIASYVGATHQRGVVEVMHYLRQRQESWLEAVPINQDGIYQSLPNVTAAFLMPCHSTPWRSHLVYPEINAWALTCEPPLNVPAADRAAYLDEADVFYADPAAWLLHNMRNIKTISTSVDPDVREDTREKEKDADRRSWPHYLVFFEQLEPTIRAELGNTRYKECRRFFNTHWHDDGRRKGDVIVWCMRR